MEDRLQMLSLLEYNNILPSQLIEITDMLNLDEELRNDLDLMDASMLSIYDLKFSLQEWTKKSNSSFYIIILDDIAIGMISLTKEKNTAKCKYWIGTEYRDKGYEAEVLEKIITLARKKKLQCLLLSKNKSNEAFSYLFENYNAFLDDNLIKVKI